MTPATLSQSLPSTTSHWGAEDYTQATDTHLQALYQEWNLAELTEGLEKKLESRVINTRYLKLKLGNQTAGGFLTYLSSYIGLSAVYESQFGDVSALSLTNAALFLASNHIANTAQRLFDLNRSHRNTPRSMATQAKEIPAFIGQVYKEKLQAYKSTSASFLTLGVLGAVFLAERLPKHDELGTWQSNLHDKVVQYGSDITQASDTADAKKLHMQIEMEKNTHPERLHQVCYFALLRQMVIHFTPEDPPKGTYKATTSLLDISLPDLNPAKLIAEGTLDGAFRITPQMPSLAELALLIQNPNPNFKSPTFEVYNRRLSNNVNLSLSEEITQDQLESQQQHMYETVLAKAVAHAIQEHVAANLSKDTVGSLNVSGVNAADSTLDPQVQVRSNRAARL